MGRLEQQQRFMAIRNGEKRDSGKGRNTQETPAEKRSKLYCNTHRDTAPSVRLADALNPSWNKNRPNRVISQV